MPLDKNGRQWDTSGEAWYNPDTGDWVHTGTPGNYGNYGYGSSGTSASAISGLPAGYQGFQFNLFSPQQQQYADALLASLSGGGIYGDTTLQNYLNNVFSQYVKPQDLGPQYAQQYYNQSVDPTLLRQAAEAQGELKRAFGPMSMGSSYKVQSNLLDKALAEQRAKALNDILFNWKQLETQDIARVQAAQATAMDQWEAAKAQALAQIPNWNQQMSIITRTPDNTGYGNIPTYSGSGGGGGATNPTQFTYDSSGSTYIGPGSKNNSNNPGEADYGTGNNFINLTTGEVTNKPSSSGNSVEFQNPFTGDAYNYVPGPATYDYRNSDVFSGGGSDYQTGGGNINNNYTQQPSPYNYYGGIPRDAFGNPITNVNTVANARTADENAIDWASAQSGW